MGDIPPAKMFMRDIFENKKVQFPEEEKSVDFSSKSLVQDQSQQPQGHDTSGTEQPDYEGDTVSSVLPNTKPMGLGRPGATFDNDEHKRVVKNKKVQFPEEEKSVDFSSKSPVQDQLQQPQGHDTSGTKQPDYEGDTVSSLLPNTKPMGLGRAGATFDNDEHKRFVKNKKVQFPEEVKSVDFSSKSLVQDQSQQPQGHDTSDTEQSDYEGDTVSSVLPNTKPMGLGKPGATFDNDEHKRFVKNNKVQFSEEAQSCDQDYQVDPTGDEAGVDQQWLDWWLDPWVYHEDVMFFSMVVWVDQQWVDPWVYHEEPGYYYHRVTGLWFCTAAKQWLSYSEEYQSFDEVVGPSFHYVAW